MIEKQNIKPKESTTAAASTPPIEIVPDDTIKIRRDEWNKVQEQLAMLQDVADKGRVFNYESRKAALGKKSKKIKLSVLDGKFVIGWATLKDKLIKSPMTGLVVSEEQQYEVLLLAPDDSISKAKIDSYSRFTDVRYTERVEVDVVGQSEDYEGKISFDVKLPDGRIIKLSDRFIN